MSKADLDLTDDPARAAERAKAFAGSDPFELLARWLEEATDAELNDPNAMALATADQSGLPNLRTVLLKGIEPPTASEPGGVLFYTNYESAKGRELSANPQAAILLHWKSLRRQIRARGPVTRVDDSRADAYYASRSYLSRIGAWASAQSQPLENRAALIEAAAKTALRYPVNPPRPPHWGGFRITPVEFEFWRDGAHRLHDRFLWRRTDLGWRTTRLNP